MRAPIVVSDIASGKVAHVSGWEDITVFLYPEYGHSQTVQVAVARDELGLGPISRWYTHSRAFTSSRHESACLPGEQVVPLYGTFRWVRVIGANQEELPFTISGRTPSK